MKPITGTELAEKRRIVMEGCYNLRDIGGYETLNGQETRWNMFYRADSLHRLTPADRQKILDVPVRTIIDLRRPEEVAELPNLLATEQGVTYLNISILNKEEKKIATMGLAQINRMMLDESQEHIARIINAIQLEENFPVIFHCTAGKDRTGLIIALLLSLVEVPDETIVLDYSLSAGYLEPVFTLLRERARNSGYDLTLYENLLSSEPETMRQTLDYLKERYGSARNYFLQIGIEPEKLDRLQEWLLV